MKPFPLQTYVTIPTMTRMWLTSFPPGKSKGKGSCPENISWSASMWEMIVSISSQVGEKEGNG